jgi:hypothetical protein
MVKAVLLGLILLLVLLPALREAYFFFRWKSRFGRRDQYEWNRWLESMRSAELTREHSQS